ncbi:MULTISPECIES: NTP transferase domain-containing protein [unclassified Duganella]|uniref:nucleotidyltransferase family protein n=1 Tax=unclassified Duganella TaxID=2636909 RepID=UPI0006F72CB7|nr:MULTISPECIES: nucleotidyltransferase family protein [unclassified Duganella]KQV44982.1 molybdopterin-guanine dinucleotide biosynthesis protein MobA [Duganella sp. Root336D2]KRB92977.1 molybdopterin-guanine dinucleotide biosynthesis protein MobA [Duganella sp. Root198D2]
MGSAVVGVLLAAGRGSRFDPTGERYKLLQALPNGDPVVVASARALLAAVPRVFAVVRPEDAATAGLLRGLGCEVVVCANAGDGMAASLACAVQHARDAGGWLIALADMPYVQPATMAALAGAVGQGGSASGTAAIAAPVHEGRRGNPVAFGRTHLQALLALAGDQGARSILKNNPVNELTVNDPGILQDIDTPSDIQ